MASWKNRYERHGARQKMMKKKGVQQRGAKKKKSTRKEGTERSPRGSFVKKRTGEFGGWLGPPKGTRKGKDITPSDCDKIRSHEGIGGE